MNIKTYKNQKVLVAFISIFFTTFVFNSHAVETCVNTTADLRSALTTAASSGENDVIKVEQGTYLITGAELSYVTSESNSISVLGGYTAGCLSREINPTNTILSRDSDEGRVIRLFGGHIVATTGALQLQGFTIKRGSKLGMFDQGAGALVGGSALFSGAVTVDLNIFIGNDNDDQNAGGLYAGSSGTVTVSNNLITDNSAGAFGGVYVLCNGSDAYISNNTIVANLLDVGGAPTSTGGMNLGGSAKFHIYNNISWGNADNDMRVTSASNIMVNNDTDDLLGTPGVGSTGNLSIDPVFVAANDYRLQETSTLIDQGTNSPPGGIPSRDLDYNFRIMGGRVDMGAYEFPQVDDTSCFVIKASNGAVPVFCL